MLWVIYQKLQHREGLTDFQQLISQLDKGVVRWTGCLLVTLMLVNWLLECVKWQYLCRPIQAISFGQAFESVFCGLSWAIFTPNRLGEYGGRVLFLQPRKRIFGVVAMGVGSFAQLVITNCMGTIALLWFIGTFRSVNNVFYAAFCVISSLFIIGMLLLFFRIHLLNRLIQGTKWLLKLQRFFALLERYTQKQLGVVFMLAVVRFMVFSSQYLFIMNVLIPEIPMIPTLLLVFLLFFVQSALPSFDLLDVGVRSITAGYLFSFVTKYDVAVMASAAAIWFINLILPAIIGAVFVFKINFFGTTTDH